MVPVEKDTWSFRQKGLASSTIIDRGSGLDDSVKDYHVRVDLC